MKCGKLLFISILILFSIAGLGISPVLASQNHDQITEITLERTMCFGTCPAYKVILRQDGTAIYIGKEFVERKGKYQGTVYKYYFDRLAKLLKSLNYFALKDNYSKPVTDLPTAITTVLTGNKRRFFSQLVDENEGNRVLYWLRTSQASLGIGFSCLVNHIPLGVTGCPSYIKILSISLKVAN